MCDQRLARVTAERDAAVKDLDELRRGTCRCFACKYDRVDYDKSACRGCDYNDNWQWRGFQKEGK